MHSIGEYEERKRYICGMAMKRNVEVLVRGSEVDDVSKW